MEFLDNGFDLLNGHDKGLHLGELRADVHLQTSDVQVGHLGSDGGVDLLDAADVHAELVFIGAGGDVFVGVGVDIGVDAHGNRRFHTHFPGNAVDGAQLVLTLAVEAVDVLLQRIADLRLGLADPGVGAEGGVAPGVDDAPQLAARHDVEADALLRHEVEDSLVGAGFDGVSHMRLERGERLAQLAEVVNDGFLAVDKGGGADGSGDVGQIHALAVQSAVLVGECVHRWGISVV